MNYQKDTKKKGNLQIIIQNNNEKIKKKTCFKFRRE